MYPELEPVAHGEEKDVMRNIVNKLVVQNELHPTNMERKTVFLYEQAGFPFHACFREGIKKHPFKAPSDARASPDIGRRRFQVQSTPPPCPRSIRPHGGNPMTHGIPVEVDRTAATQCSQIVSCR